MERLKRTFSMRKKRDTNVESNKPHQWQEDERKVREGSCSFQVKYLGCIEVFESRGIQICEEAVKALKSRKRRSAWSRLSFRKKRGSSQQSKSNHHRAILYVTGDALRVVDEISKGLIVDQTIEKVSFCAPDRNHEKGFAYICRDGTTRRWMCHGFLAVKESGERLSHAVGCAFAICLEKKQAREKEKVTVTFSENGTSFTRMGSFRQTTLTERLADPQSAIVAEPVPVCKIENPYAVQRPHASADMLERQGSFRGFTRLADSSPFKRNISLRLNELPSTLERQRQVATGILGPQQYDSGIAGPASANASGEPLEYITSHQVVSASTSMGWKMGVSSLVVTNGDGFGTIMEAEESEMSPVSDACQQLTEGLLALSARDNVTALTSVPATVTVPAASAVTFSSAQPMPPYAAASAVPQPVVAGSGVFPGHPAYNVGIVSAQPMPVVVGSPYTVQHRQPLNPVILNHSVTEGQQLMPFGSPHIVAPGPSAHVNNPWSQMAVHSAAALSSPPVVTTPAQSKVSDAEYWLNSTASQIDPFAAVPNVGGKPAAHRPRVVNGSADPRLSGQTSPHTMTAVATVHHHTSVTTADQQPPSFISTPVRAGEQIPVARQPGIHTLNASRPLITSSSGVRPVDSQPFDPFDSAFDSAWAAKSSNRSATSTSAPVNNPFQTSVDKVIPAFEVKL